MRSRRWELTRPMWMARPRSRAFGCTSCDGTYLAFGPDTNLPRLLAWMNELHTSPTLFGDET
ncbi:hypothetical protein [Streptomyces massasporeus]|uniref:hypothetical protein n=1 Tax=Streptomyces massasporeus TaxID=67324 RepID=UPI00382E3160